MPIPALVYVAGAGLAGLGAWIFTRKQEGKSISPLPSRIAKAPVAPQAQPRPQAAPPGFAPAQPAFAPSQAVPQAAPVFAQPPATPFAPPPPPPVIVAASSGTINRKSKEYGMWLQSSLNQINAAGLAVDGAVGPKTSAAVRSYQQKRGLAADGISGPQTEASLMKDGAPSPPGFQGLRPAPVPGFVDLDAAESALQQAINSPEVTVLGNIANAAANLTPIPAAVRSTSGYKKWLQASLNTVDPPSPLLTVDGAIGPKSTAAVKHFQSSHGLSADGVVGPATEGALMAALVASGASAVRPPGA